jgi:hypothetical protein
LGVGEERREEAEEDGGAQRTAREARHSGMVAQGSGASGASGVSEARRLAGSRVDRLAISRVRGLAGWRVGQ